MSNNDEEKDKQFDSFYASFEEKNEMNNIDNNINNDESDFYNTSNQTENSNESFEFYHQSKENNDILSTNNNENNTNNVYQYDEQKNIILPNNKVKKTGKIFLIIFYIMVFVVGIIVFVIFRSLRYAFYLEKDEVFIMNSGTYQVEMTPRNIQYFDYLNYKYEIDDTSVATVDRYGMVTAVGAGETNLRIKIKLGYGTKVLKIRTEDVKIEQIELKVDNNGKIEQNNISLYVNESIALKTYVNQKDNYNAKINYTSSDDSIASVDEFGVITSKKVGKVTIYGAKDGVSGKIIVEVKEKPKETSPSKVKVESVNLGITNTTIYVNDNLQLSVRVNPSNATNYTITWSSSNNDVASINDNGLVTAKKEGTVVIKAIVDGIETKATIIVKEKNNNQISQEKESISLNQTNVKMTVGEKTTLVATLNNNKSNQITWISSDESIAKVDSSGNVIAKKAGKTSVMALANTNLKASAIIEIQGEKFTDDYLKWYNKAYSYAKNVDYSTIVRDNSDYLAWRSYYIINGFHRAYLATGEQVFINKIAESLYGIYKLAKDSNDDGYLNWGTSYPKDGVGYEEYVVHAGTIVSCVANFLNLLEGKPELYNLKISSGETFREVAKYILDITINHIIPGYEVDWNNQYGVYMNRKGSKNYSGLEGISLPNNQYLIMAYGLLELSKLDIDSKIKNDYYQKAIKMIKNFNNHVIRNADGTLTWNYKDVLFEGDKEGFIEDYSHGMHDIDTAIAAYSAGIVFTKDDIEAFAKTYDTKMFVSVGGVPMLTNNVNGKGCENKKNCGHIFLKLFDLSNYSSNIWIRGKDYIEKKGESDTYAKEDYSRVIAFHKDAPKPYNFSLTYPNDKDGTVKASFAVFRWENSVRASGYDVIISTNPDLSNAVIARSNLLETSMLVTDKLKRGQTYYWQVTAKNIGGHKTKSNIYSFKAI